MSHDDYLWDRSGPVDEEVAELEELLGELRFRRPMPAIDTRPLIARARLEADATREAARARQRPWSILMVAAGFVLVCAAWIVRGSQGAPTPVARLPQPAPRYEALGAAPQSEGWAVTVLRGTPTCDGAPLAGDDTRALGVGKWLETGPGDEARVAVADIGELSLGPQSRLKLVASDDVHRVALDRGRLHALVDAPPRVFLVDTPSATAVDLGCEYELDVRDDGSVGLRVDLGWVALEGKRGLPTYVPAGFRAETDRHGIGLPIRVDAPAPLERAVRAHRSGGAISGVVDACGADDLATLWHALVRSDARADVYQRMIALGAVPADDAAQIAAGDEVALRGWGERLGVIPPPGWPHAPPASAGDPELPPDQAPPVWRPDDDGGDGKAPKTDVWRP